MRDLKKHHGQGDFCLYLDNLKIHKCEETWDVYDELGIHPVFAPKYSPEYNPIELVFSKLKEWTRRQRLQDMLKERKRTYWELVPEAVKQVTPELVDRCITHVERLLIEAR